VCVCVCVCVDLSIRPTYTHTHLQVRNALRLLRPGGHLCVCDFTVLPDKGQWALSQRMWSTFLFLCVSISYVDVTLRERLERSQNVMLVSGKLSVNVLDLFAYGHVYGYVRVLENACFFSYPRVKALVF
jgi:hypothetical protein